MANMVNEMTKYDFKKRLHEELIKRTHDDEVSVEMRDDSINLVSSDGFVLQIDCEHLYHSMVDEEEIGAIANLAISNFNFILKNSQLMQSDKIRNFEQVKNNIFIRVVPRNNRMLSDIPHLDIMDLSIIYYIELSSNNGKEVSIVVTDSIFEMWNISFPSMHSIAAENTFVTRGPKIMTLRESLYEIQGLEGSYYNADINDAIVVTNEDFMLGAIHMFNTDALLMVCLLLSADKLFVVPSSIHEIIVFPANAIDGDFLIDILRNINLEHLQPNEVLSNNLYLFNREDRKLSVVKKSH